MKFSSLIKRLSPYIKNDSLYLRLLYFASQGIMLGLSTPKRFTEKIQWLKIHDRKPMYSNCVDKYEVKKYVGNLIGESYIIPTLGIWKNPEEIDWDSLPNSFVLKTTHGGGNNGVIICKNKNLLDKNQVVNKLKESLNYDIYKRYREWPYKNVHPQIIVEEYMHDNVDPELTDYKFFCFNGEPKYCQVIRDRRTKETIDFYDMEWKLMPFVGLNPNCKNGDIPVPKPEKLYEMTSICRTLSKSIPFVRIDMYLISNRIFFGEMTFYPGSGLGRFRPDSWDEKLGSLLEINC